MDTSSLLESFGIRVDTKLTISFFAINASELQNNANVNVPEHTFVREYGSAIFVAYPGISRTL